ncbi:MAG: hypothetical protein ACK4WJ_06360, partial [Endomicrobiia bacterium]
MKLNRVPSHSMDTVFYALTETEQLVSFYTGENGIIPAKFVDFTDIALDIKLNLDDYSFIYQSIENFNLKSFKLGYIDLNCNSC